jgi:N-acetylneuraminic acid mutarotase
MNRTIITIALLVLVLVGLAPRAEAGLDSLNFIGGTMLGRPTDHSVAISIVTRAALECYFEYGTSPGSYPNQTALDTTAADTLHSFQTALTGLTSGTRYYYRMRYRPLGSGTWLNGDPGFFRTQLARGQSFTFQVEGDPHMLPGEQATDTVFNVTLANMARDSADFMIDLGDNFMLDKWARPNNDTITKRMLAYRRWWGQICGSDPLYMVLGNHEGEQGWDLNGTDTCWPVRFTNARKNYYTNPLPDAFYSGDTTPQPYVGLRQDYYAWEWGNALYVVLDPYWYTTVKPQNQESNWNWTLGRAQYDWLKRTLEQSGAKFKFVFIHHLVGGKIDATARGGSEYAHFYEWGGLRTDSTWGFDAMRPGWGVPIHQLLMDNHVDIMFHGHDHFYAKQDTDGIVYQMAPQPAQNRYDSIPGQATNYGYTHGVLIGVRGYIRVKMDDTSATVAYVRTYLPNEETTGVRRNRDISHSYTILKGRKDVGVTRVVAPAGTLDSGTTIMPACSLYNYGTLAASYRVRLQIGTAYDCTVSVASHLRGTAAHVTFPPWIAGPVGTIAVKCSTLLPGDEEATNDHQVGTVLVKSLLSPGWLRMSDMPLGPKLKAVKDGACLVYLEQDTSSRVYSLKGNNRCEFYAYNPLDNVWATKESIPAFGASGRKKMVKKGGTLTEVAGVIYATKGNNTVEFWSYTPGTPAGVWTQKADVPVGARNVKEGAGAAGVSIRDSVYVYLLKGSNTTEFYRYSIAANAWEPLASPPVGISGRTYKNGSCIAGDGDNTIYALKGSYNELYAYDIAANVWSTKTSLPFIGSSGRKVKTKDGCGIAHADGVLYCLKGGNSFEYWRYQADTDRWTQLTDIPLGGGKKVKGGGALVAAGNALFALKGNNTLEFYTYMPTACHQPLTADDANIQGKSEFIAQRSSLNVFPNPFTSTTMIYYTLPAPVASPQSPVAFSLGLYDVTGKLITALASGLRPGGTTSCVLRRASGLSRGVYILKLDTQSSRLVTQSARPS